MKYLIFFFFLSGVDVVFPFWKAKNSCYIVKYHSCRHSSGWVWSFVCTWGSNCRTELASYLLGTRDIKPWASVSHDSSLCLVSPPEPWSECWVASVFELPRLGACSVLEHGKDGRKLGTCPTLACGATGLRRRPTCRHRSTASCLLFLLLLS